MKLWQIFALVPPGNSFAPPGKNPGDAHESRATNLRSQGPRTYGAEGHEPMESRAMNLWNRGPRTSGVGTFLVWGVLQPKTHLSREIFSHFLCFWMVFGLRNSVKGGYIKNYHSFYLVRWGGSSTGVPPYLRHCHEPMESGATNLRRRGPRTYRR